MRIGAIDCGTNSLRLLITESTQTGQGYRLKELERVMKVVRLGEGVDSTGEFSPAALERTFTVAQEYSALLQKYGVDSLRFVATSATRDAKNRQLFISGIKEILGVTPEVISGSQEAELSYTGAVSALNETDGLTLVIDLGGGSTEFVLGDHSGVQAARSIDIGCVRLSERHSMSNPPTPEQTRLVRADVDAALDTVFSVLDVGTLQRVVGVAGTVTTVTAQALALASYDAQTINGTTLSLKTATRAAAELTAMTGAERAALGFMHPGRVDVIGTGALIWSRILNRLHQETQGAITTVTTSEYDILDGIALSQLPASN